MYGKKGLIFCNLSIPLDMLRLTAFYALSAVASTSPVSIKVYVSVGNKTFYIHHRSPATLLRMSFCNPTIVTMFISRR